MRLKYKAALNMFLFGVFFIISVAIAYHYYFQRLTLVNAHHSTQKLADEVARHIESHLEERAKIASTMVSAPLILQALTASNEQLAVLSEGERIEKIASKNKKS